MVKTAQQLLLESIPEEEVHIQIADWLDLVLYPDTYFTTVEVSNQQGGSTGRNKQGRNKRRGVKTGFPDILLIYKGQVYLMEVKRYGKYATEVQLEEHEKLRIAGAIVHKDSVHNIEEARQFLKKYKIPTREIYYD